MRPASLHLAMVSFQRSPRPSRPRARRTVLSIGLVVALAGTAASASGCADGNLPSESPDSLETAAIVAESDELEGVVGEELEDAVVVRLEAEDGSPLPDVTLRFATEEAAGVVAPEVVRTNDDGRASAVWTLGPKAGKQLLSVTPEGAEIASSILTGTARPGTSHALVVSPEAADIERGVPSWLSASVVDRFGNPTQEPGTVLWTSSDGSVVHVGPEGAVLGLRLGRAEVTAETTFPAEETGATGSADPTNHHGAGHHSGRAVLDVVEPDEDGLRIAVASGDGQTAPAGATLVEPLVVEVIDPDGGSLRGVPVEWEVVAEGGTLVDSLTHTRENGRTDNLWTLGSAGGEQVVRARVGEIDSVEFSARVHDPGGTGPAPACDDPGPGWIWCDDFETDRASSYFEYVDRNGSFTRAAGVGKDGSWGMRTRFSEGQVSAGSLKLAFGRTPSDYFEPVDEGTADHHEIYWRVHVRYQEDWQGNGAEKMSRVTSFATSRWAQSMIGHVWSGDGPNDPYLVLDPASGTDEGGLKTTAYNDFPNLTWLGAETGDTPLFAAESRGTWFCVEARVRLNTPGEDDGVFELWIDDKLDARITGLNWRDSYDAFGINAMFLENYWDGGSPRDQERYFDGLVVSTERIGCER